VNASGADGHGAMLAIARNWGKYFKPYYIMKILIESGADFSSKGQKKVRNCIKKHDSLPERTLRLEIFDALRKGFEPWNCDEWACEEYVCEPDTAEADLFAAAAWGSAAEIESALSRGVGVNAASVQGYTPLMFASVLNKPEAVRFFIGKGAAVGAKNKQNETALMLACQNGRADIIPILAEAGADVNASSANGVSSFFLVYSEETALALVKAGADINTKNDSGDTALKLAMEQSRFKIVRALLAAGADPKCILDDESEDAAGNKTEPDDKYDEDDKKDNNNNFRTSLRQFGLEA
jgi:ankyrin repeat protein